MRLGDALIKNTFLGKTAKTKPGETRPGILVPVNSSVSAFNSLEYALNLAKVLHTTIHLFYVADVDELAESSNPVVVNRMLDRLDRKAANCVESLKEMIEESGVKVLTAESMVGNVGLLIQKKVEFLMPGMIVIGRDSFSKGTLNNLIGHATCPVLFVPESATPRLPSSIILASDQSAIPEKTLSPLFKIIQGTTQELTILNIVKRKKYGERRVQNHLTSSNCNILLNYYQHEDTEVTKGVDNFVQANVVDLLCTIHRKRPLLRRIFNRNVSSELVYRLGIPVLVMRES